MLHDIAIFHNLQGMPFPDQEREAIDVVVKYAVTKLGFELNNIMMFAWSIGGYSASYAAMMYPDIKAVVSFVVYQICLHFFFFTTS